MVDQHIETGAAVTVAALRAPLEQADQFGVDRGGRRRPHDHRVPREAQGRRRAGRRARPGLRLDGQLRVHHRGADRGGDRGRRGRRRPATTWAATSSRCSVERGAAHVYDFSKNDVPGESERDHGYWRDVGTLDAFYDAHMDLISVDPVFNLYNMRVADPDLARAAAAGQVRVRRGRPHAATRSTRWCARAWSISGGEARRSVLSPGVHVHSYAEVEDSVLMPGVDVGRDAVVRQRDPRQERRVEPGAQIGVDLEPDRERVRGLRRRRRRRRQGRRWCEA